MTEPVPEFRQFALAVHGRAVAVRGVETFAVASAVTVPLVAASRWWGMAGVPTATAAMGVAVLVALAAAWRRRRRLFASVAAADRHFGWDDLLPTALTVPGEDGFAAVVRAAADARCRGQRAGDVPVGRLHRGGWAVVSAIVLAAAVAAVLRPATSPGSQHRSPVPDDPASVLTADAGPAPAPGEAVRPRPLAVAPTDERSTQVPTDPPPADLEGRRAEAAHGSADHAAGGGAGRSNSPVVDPATPQRSSVTETRSGSPAGPVAAAGGAPLASTGSPEGPAGQTAAIARGPNEPGPTLGQTVPPASAGDRAAADAVPPRDRALVRSYFDH